MYQNASLCFLTVTVMWPFDSRSCSHSFLTMTGYVLELSDKANHSSPKSFLVQYFLSPIRKALILFINLVFIWILNESHGGICVFWNKHNYIKRQRQQGSWWSGQWHSRLLCSFCVSVCKILGRPSGSQIVFQRINTLNILCKQSELLKIADLFLLSVDFQTLVFLTFGNSLTIIKTYFWKVYELLTYNFWQIRQLRKSDYLYVFLLED